MPVFIEIWAAGNHLAGENLIEFGPGEFANAAVLLEKSPNIILEGIEFLIAYKRVSTREAELDADLVLLVVGRKHYHLNTVLEYPLGGTGDTGRGLLDLGSLEGGRIQEFHVRGLYDRSLDFSLAGSIDKSKYILLGRVLDRARA